MNKMKELIVQFIEAESKANKNDQDYVNCDCCLQRFSRQDVSYLDENSDLSHHWLRCPCRLPGGSCLQSFAGAI
mgnify:CR=1 FL=1